MVRRWLALGAATSVLAFAAAAAAQSGPDPLVAVLVEKGVISQADAAGVTTRDQLVKLLEAKGVLSQNDVNSIAQAEPQMLASNGAAPPNEAPVYFHEDHPTTLTLGPVDLTVGGFVDTMNTYRTTNTGNESSTSFGAIPFPNTIAGNISEDRITANNSRLSLTADSTFDWGGQPVRAVGYFEGDFLGNDPTNVFVTANGHTFRIRQFFLDAQRGQWEIQAGQSWSWMTPNRYGLSSYPDAVFVTNDYDPGYNVGLTYTRDAELRVAYHPNQNLAVGVALVTPDQFTNGEVTFPSGYNAQLGVEFDAANITTTPNEFPDLLAKVAYDNKTSMGLPFHLEAVGLISQFRAAYLPEAPVPTNTFTRTSTTGWGLAVNGNVEVMPGLTLLGDAFYSEGGGRYITGLGPDVVALPVPDGTVVRSVSGGGFVTVCCSGLRLSDVQSESLLGGIEWRPTSQWTVSSYFGYAHFDRNFALDITSTAAKQPFIGFGGPDSANTNNKQVTEFTFEPQYKIWSSPTGGILSAGLQASYIERWQWFVAAGAPGEANLGMFIFDVRYTLP
jgi:hypothetical protein